MMANMNNRAVRLLCATVISACSPVPHQAAGDSTTSTTSTTGEGQSETGIVTPTSSTSTSTSTTGTSTSTGSTDDPSSPSGFIAHTDGGAGNKCDPYSQDCAPGEKCTWWADDGGSAWSATKCVPVADDPAKPGEPCVAEGGGVSGIDDCELGTMCWDVDLEGNGVCFSLCGGTEEKPICPPDTGCRIFGVGTAMCFETCDPLAQDCPPGDLCSPVSATYQCMIDASGDSGHVHDPCEYANDCDPGLLCIPPTAAVECDQQAVGCCEPMCDLDAPDPCPGVGQVCTPVHELPPQDFENVGYCTLPP